MSEQAGSEPAARAPCVMARARGRRAGYGNSAPNNCWGPIMLVTVQTLVGVFLDAVVIGVIFARISHPKRAPPAFPPTPWPAACGLRACALQGLGRASARGQQHHSPVSHCWEPVGQKGAALHLCACACVASMPPCAIGDRLRATPRATPNPKLGAHTGTAAARSPSPTRP